MGVHALLAGRAPAPSSPLLPGDCHGRWGGRGGGGVAGRAFRLGGRGGGRQTPSLSRTTLRSASEKINMSYLHIIILALRPIGCSPLPIWPPASLFVFGCCDITIGPLLGCDPPPVALAVI